MMERIVQSGSKDVLVKRNPRNQIDRVWGAIGRGGLVLARMCSTFGLFLERGKAANNPDKARYKQDGKA